MADANAIVEVILREFPQSDSLPDPKKVEEVMRQFGKISYETERQIEKMLFEHGRSPTSLGIGCWLEANFVVTGSGPILERRIQFLLMDTCTCVLEHLPKAIEHATNEIDPRIRALSDRCK
ncbi:MAG: hypothetical protein RIQ56_901 [Candidatus Parcubacteria bacterium]|jgi:hypothetical protein